MDLVELDVNDHIQYVYLTAHYFQSFTALFMYLLHPTEFRTENVP